MKVSACLVTRGDVDMGPILRSLPEEWEVIVWDNGAGELRRRVLPSIAAKVVLGHPLDDMSVYGRYAAINFAAHDLIYVQDDDVIVSDPRGIVKAWIASRDDCAEEQFDPKFLWHASPEEIKAVGRGEHICCNMPQEFRHDFYRQHSLVGFGAVFQRDLPRRAFDRWYAGAKDPSANGEWGKIRRTCDIIVTGLSPRVLVDVPKENLPYAEAESRMYRQPEHQADRKWMLEQVTRVREEAK